MLGVGLGGAGCTDQVRVGPSGTVQLGLTEYRMRPDDIIAAAGQMTFVAHNEGRLPHNLVVAAGSTVLGTTPAIPPGGIATLTVVLPAGHYSIFSSIQSDSALGEHGTLTVTG